MSLRRSHDRKVTNSVTPDGKGSRVANAFGLPAGQRFSCPGATEFCESICYAGKLEKIYKGVRGVLTANFEALNSLSYAGMFELLAEMIDDFRKDSAKRDAELLFRIHWDGDFFSAAYTAAWAEVIRCNPDIQFWVYTRVATSAVFLYRKNFANLGLYFSADPDNIEIARNLEAIGLNIAYVDKTFAAGKEEFSNATRCPENNRSIDLISVKGSACARCGLCVNGRKSVLFSTSKR